LKNSNFFPPSAAASAKLSGFGGGGLQVSLLFWPSAAAARYELCASGGGLKFSVLFSKIVLVSRNCKVEEGEMII
jgi:hypothetical protein